MREPISLDNDSWLVSTLKSRLRKKYIQLDRTLLFVKATNLTKESTNFARQSSTKLIQIASEIVRNHFLSSGPNSSDCVFMLPRAILAPGVPEFIDEIYLCLILPPKLIKNMFNTLE